MKRAAGYAPTVSGDDAYALRSIGELMQDATGVKIVDIFGEAYLNGRYFTLDEPNG